MAYSARQKSILMKYHMLRIFELTKNQSNKELQKIHTIAARALNNPSPEDKQAILDQVDRVYRELRRES